MRSVDRLSFLLMAEGVGFEPTVPQSGTTVFETARFNRSRTLPRKCTEKLPELQLKGRLSRAAQGKVKLGNGSLRS